MKNWLKALLVTITIGIIATLSLLGIGAIINFEKAQEATINKEHHHMDYVILHGDTLEVIIDVHTTVHLRKK